MPTNNKYTNKITCNKKGGVKTKRTANNEYGAMQLIYIFQCAKLKNIKKLFKKPFKIKSGTVIVSDVHNNVNNNKFNKNVKNVKKGNYYVYRQKQYFY